MSWTISLDRLAASGIIGVHAWERKQPQTLYITLQLSADLKAAADQDEVGLTIDYSEVAQRVRQVVTDTQAQLIEHLAKRVADDLCSAFPLTALVVRIDKPDAVPATASTSVTYRWDSQAAT